MQDQDGIELQTINLSLSEASLTSECVFLFNDSKFSTQYAQGIFFQRSYRIDCAATCRWSSPGKDLGSAFNVKSTLCCTDEEKSEKRRLVLHIISYCILTY